MYFVVASACHEYSLFAHCKAYPGTWTRTQPYRPEAASTWMGSSKADNSGGDDNLLTML